MLRHITARMTHPDDRGAAAGCCWRLLCFFALAVVVILVTRDLAPTTQLALAGAGFVAAVLTVAAFWLVPHWQR